METRRATTAIFIDKYHPKADGKCSVTIRVTYDRKRKYFPTPYSLTPDEFEKTQGAKPRGEYKELSLKLQAYEKKASDIIESLTVFTWDGFERQYLTNRGTRNQVAASFEDYISHLKKSGRVGTAISYECAKRSIEVFNANARFLDITPDFLRRYESWMLEKGNSVTTIGIYLRSLRTIFNNAISDGLITREYYPFGRKQYEIPTGRNIKKALNEDGIRSIFKYNADAGTTKEMARDLWIFSYLCNGMNVKDICRLKYKNLDGDFLQYQRAKTARTKRDVEPIRVFMNQAIKGIISKWGNQMKSPETYIFPILRGGLTPERERELIQNITQTINKHMKGIGKELGISINLTTYVARHSFASVLVRNGSSVYEISKLLDHGSEKTTQNYIASLDDESRVTVANKLTSFIND